MPKRIQLSYQPNPSYQEGRPDIPRLFATVDLRPYGADAEIRALPIFFRNLERPLGPVRQVYGTVLAGLPIEKGNLPGLEKSLDLYLGAMVHFGRLPRYFFKVGDSAWPIYRLPDQLVTRYPGSPVFRGDSIGDLRHALAANLKVTGQIRNRKQVQVLALSAHDLQLYRPLCFFRAQGIADIPVFAMQNGAGAKVVAPVNARALSVPLETSTDLLRLQEAVANYLRYRGIAEDRGDVTLRKLTPATWQRLQAALVPAAEQLMYHVQVAGRLLPCDVPLFRYGSQWIAARTNSRQRTALHVGGSVRALQASLGDELYREGKLSSPHYLTVRRHEKVRAGTLFSL